MRRYKFHVYKCHVQYMEIVTQEIVVKLGLTWKNLIYIYVEYITYKFNIHIYMGKKKRKQMNECFEENSIFYILHRYYFQNLM